MNRLPQESFLPRSHRAATGLVAFALLAALAGVSSVRAQVPVTKEPTGPFVEPAMPPQLPMVNLGEEIVWEVTVTNPLSPDPVFADFWDTPQHPECEPGGVSRDWGVPEDPVAGNGMETAPQETLVFIDNDGDGDCGETGETVIDAADGLVICEMDTMRLRILNAVVPGSTPGFPPMPGVATVRFRTLVQEEVDGTPVGSGQIICNWGHVYDDLGTEDLTDDELIQPTSAPGAMTFGCTCLTSAPPNEFDFESEKVATAETLPLVPGDPAATVLFEVTARNTGGEGIAGGSFNDPPSPGLEWVEVVDCPAPLTCNIDGMGNWVVSGFDLPAADPDPEVTFSARARVTCEAATDDDSGEICNRGEFSLMGRIFPTDDPAQPGLDDPTCQPVVFSDLTESTKSIESFDDADGDGLLSAGDTVHFAITAFNAGSLAARDVVITDDGLDDTCFDVSTLDVMDGGTVTAGVITWDVGDLTLAARQQTVRFSVVFTGSESCCNQATVQSAERIECGLVDPLPTNNPATMLTDDDATCAIPGPRPDLTVTKTWELEDDLDMSTDISNGVMVSFTITIENSDAPGTGTATEAELIDDLPPCLTRFLNPLPDGFGEVIPNELTTTDPGGGAEPAGTDMSDPFAGGLNPGTLRITNLGGDNGIIPGEVITVKFFVIANQVNVCCNGTGEGARVEYLEALEPVPTDDPSTPGRLGDPTCFVDPPSEPQFELDKDVEVFDDTGDGFIGDGDRARYTLTLRSVGFGDLTNVTISDPSNECYELDESSVTFMPSDRFIDDSVPGSNALDLTVTDPMPPGDSVSVVYDVVFSGDFSELTPCCNQATFSSGEFSDEPSNDPRDFIDANATCVDLLDPPAPPVALSIDKTADAAGCVDPGSTVTFTLTVENTGEAIVDVWSLLDDLSPDLTNVAADPPLVYDGAAHSISLDGGAVIGSLAPTDVETFTYTADVPCTESGTVANDALLTFTDMARTAMDGVSVDWGVPDLSTSEKVLDWTDTNGNGWIDRDVAAENDLTYTITVQNDGTCAARDVVVTDVLDGRLDLGTVVLPPAEGGTLAGDTISWDAAGNPALASIPAGGSVVLTFDVQVDTATSDGARIPNDVLFEPTGNSVAACPGLPELEENVPAGEDVPWEEPLVATVDLLRNADVTALGEDIAPLFTDTPNLLCVGDTRLDRAADLFAADVDPAAGVTVAGDAMPGSGNPLVFYELAEDCGLIDVVKSGDDVIVRERP